MLQKTFPDIIQAELTSANNKIKLTAKLNSLQAICDSKCQKTKIQARSKRTKTRKIRKGFPRYDVITQDSNQDITLLKNNPH